MGHDPRALRSAGALDERAGPHPQRQPDARRAEGAGTPGERAIALALAGWLEGFGAQVEVSDVADGRPNVYGLVPGRTERLVVLDVHTDTVSVEHMVEEPFDGRIEDGCVWGRGALDTKASLGVILTLLERWAAAGQRPEPNLLVVGSISEEGGGMLGRHRLPGVGRGAGACGPTRSSCPSRPAAARSTATRAVPATRSRCGARRPTPPGPSSAAAPSWPPPRAVLALQERARPAADRSRRSPKWASARSTSG